MSTFKELVDAVGLAIDGVGVLAIVMGLMFATVRYATVGQKEAGGYRRFRQDLGRGILLGLEFLVAADIIRTVAVVPTLQGVLVLGLIVLIRTFLSMALQVELEGRWPWQTEVAVPPTPGRAAETADSPLTPKGQSEAKGV